MSIVGPDVPRRERAGPVVFRPLSPALRMQVDLLVAATQGASRLATLFHAAAKARAAELTRPDPTESTDAA